LSLDKRKTHRALKLRVLKNASRFCGRARSPSAPDLEVRLPVRQPDGLVPVASLTRRQTSSLSLRNLIHRFTPISRRACHSEHSEAESRNLLLMALFAQKQAQLSQRFTVLRSSRCFLYSNQRRQINALETHAKTFHFKGMRQKIFLLPATDYFAKETEITERRRKCEVTTVANRTTPTTPPTRTNSIPLFASAGESFSNCALTGRLFSISLPAQPHPRVEAPT
jgi:hypothetical protein